MTVESMGTSTSIKPDATDVIAMTAITAAVVHIIPELMESDSFKLLTAILVGTSLGVVIGRSIGSNIVNYKHRGGVQ